MAAPPSFPPAISQPAPARPPPPSKGRFSALALAGAGAAGFVVGVLVAVLAMWLLMPQLGTSAAPAASASASADAMESAAPIASESATASDVAQAAPAIDPAAAARARKLAELRKKVKGKRAKQLDGQCKQLKKSFEAGYVYDGGTFAENEMVANSAGCVALAKASKAPWFCCPK